MGQFFQDNIPIVVRATTTSLSIPATYQGQPASARIGGQGYTWSSPLTMNGATTGIGGLDTGTLITNALYYIYLVVSSGAVGMVASLNGPAVGPTGFTQFREIARIRTFVVAATFFYPANQIIGNAKQSSLVTGWMSYTGEMVGGGTATYNALANTRNTAFRIVGNSIDVMFHRLVVNAGSGSVTVSVPLPENVTFNAADHPALENNVGTWHRFNGSIYTLGGGVIARSGVIFIENSGTAQYFLGSNLVAGTEFKIPIKDLSLIELIGLYD